MEEFKLVEKHPYDYLRETIPTWRKLIMKTGLKSNDVLNANSYWKSDASLINEDGTLLNGRQREDGLVLFDLKIDKFIHTETINDVTLINLEAKIIFDFYGELAYHYMTQIYGYLFQENQLLDFIKAGIGINPDIQITNSYETIHGIQWLRGNMEVKFTYTFTIKNENEYVDNLELNVKKGNENE